MAEFLLPSEIADDQDLWVFGYGSLMWRPGFDFVEQRLATLQGYHRSFCIYSHHHRGTQKNPGLVLGLGEGGSCVGCAYLIHGCDVADVTAYLNQRELIGYAYVPRTLDVTLEGGDGMETANQIASTYTFIADRAHEHYAGNLPIADSARLIMKAEGVEGLNRDYLINTLGHLEQMGVAEPELYALLREVEGRTGA